MTISCGIFLSCNKNSAKEKEIIPPLIEKPNPSQPSQPIEEEIDITTYRWYYKGGVDGVSSTTEIKSCPTDFMVDGVCDSALTLCKNKISLYACYPENLEIHIKGKILDENNHPIENVKIQGSLGVPDYDEIGEAYTRKSGKFTFKISNFCVHLISAFKDGYVSSLGEPYVTTSTQCKVEDFIGAKDLTINLKKIPRSIQNIEAKSEANFCRIVGRVTNADGSGLSGVKISNGRYSTLSGMDGNYSIEKQEKCNNYCTLGKKGYRSIFPEKRDSAVVSCFLGQPGDVVFEPE